MCPITSKARFTQTNLNIGDPTGVLLFHCCKGLLGQRAEKPPRNPNMVLTRPSGDGKPSPTCPNPIFKPH